MHPNWPGPGQLFVGTCYQPVSARNKSALWDGNGGRHCPSYVQGWDPHKKAWVERIYYAGAAEKLWGPYTIGFLEWDGKQWQDQPEPAFGASEDWEHGSVYEPNLVYHAGKWKIWYVAGSTTKTIWSTATRKAQMGAQTGANTLALPRRRRRCSIFAFGSETADSRLFFLASGWEGVNAAGDWAVVVPRKNPFGALSDWGEPIQSMAGENRGWHAGPWKPSLQFANDTGRRGFIFFDGMYRTADPGPFPFVFTLGYAEVELPAQT